MYNYKTEKSELFTEEAQVLFLKIRDEASQLLRVAGCFRMQEAIRNCTGSSWQMFACVDRMVELGEIVEVTRGNEISEHYRIFTRPDGLYK